jgi:tetratricopeptide (TPR) repeat protein
MPETGNTNMAGRLQPRCLTTTVGPLRRLLLAILLIFFAFLCLSGACLTGARLTAWLVGAPALGPRGLWLFLGHLAAGVAVLPVLVAFVASHWQGARYHPNRLAYRRGIWLATAAAGIALTGIALVQIEGLPQLQAGTWWRATILAMHAGLPLAAGALYLAHRRVGPPIVWRAAPWFASGATLAVAGCLLAAGLPGFHGMSDGVRAALPATADDSRATPFWPAATRTVDNQLVAEASLMNDSYCLRCHEDAYRSWFHSAHHFSSFNNPAYRASVRETRAFLERRDGSARAVQWCGGCHDPVPLLSGRLGEPGFDDVADPTAHAGITCTVCHAVTEVHTLAGNGGYTVAEPEHYPFTSSESAVLQWINGQLIRAKPDFHRQSFLKPVHRSAEFCSSCHKVSIPPELNHYKDFLRGQNHYDSFLLSGVSGHGARSFYYPEKASENCAACHMPLHASDDPAARDFSGSGIASVHDHLFPGANTGLPTMLAAHANSAGEAAGFHAAARAHSDFLRGVDPQGRDRKLRIDIFGLKDGGRTDGKLVAPLRPELPVIDPGRSYLVEVVVRTLALGHHFTQGTADSNEVWVEFTAVAEGRSIATSGLMAGPGDQGVVDPSAYRLNAILVDRQGRKIDRRNVQDIFATAANREIPPGAAEVIHYRLDVPADLRSPLTLAARVRYRKFDDAYVKFMEAGRLSESPIRFPALPVVDLCEDRITLPVSGGTPADDTLNEQRSPIEPAWQRWNDYGIGCLLEGDFQGAKGELRQAEAAFRRVTAVPEAASFGWINLARVYLEEGRLGEAAAAVNEAAAAEPPAPWWHLAWFGGSVTAENASAPADLDRAIEAFSSILVPENQPRSRAFDFSRDYVVRNQLAATLFKRSLTATGAERADLLRSAIGHYDITLTGDPENLSAHYGLMQCHSRLAGGASDPRATEAAAIAAEPLNPTGGRLPRLFALRDRLHGEVQNGPLTEGDHAAFAAIHLAIHASLRPDELATAAAVTTLRASDPDVDRAAEPVPVYPLMPADSTGNAADGATVPSRSATAGGVR